MRMIDARTGIEVIGYEECLALLAAENVGRLAVIAGGAPSITPVNYAMDGEDIVFRTAAGTKLDHGPRHPAAFEIDSLHREEREGWSVVVTGRLEEVTSYQDATYRRVQDLPVDPWADGAKPHWMRLRPLHITGRAVRHDDGSY